MFTGGTFTCFESTTTADFALLACESVHGQCNYGSCGEFEYYKDINDMSCDCNKEVGDLEWVYERGSSATVSMIIW